MFASTSSLSKKHYPILCPMPPRARFALIFDVETTGLLPKQSAYDPAPLLSAYPHIIQFSWLVYDLATNMIEAKRDFYVKLPSDVRVSEQITQITGITQSMCDTGHSIQTVLREFIRAYNKCDMAIAHNLQFDATVIQSEIIRNLAHLPQLSEMPHIFSDEYVAEHGIILYCTMVASRDVCNLSFAAPKAPSVSDASINLIPVSALNIPLSPVVISSSLTSLELIRIPSPVVHPSIDLSNNMLPPPPSLKQSSTEPNLSYLKPKPLYGVASTTSSKSGTYKRPSSSYSNMKKFPKLSELHMHLFGYVPENLHNSMIDSMVCLRCFLKIRCSYSMSNRKFDILISKC